MSTFSALSVTKLRLQGWTKGKHATKEQSHITEQNPETKNPKKKTKRCYVIVIAITINGYGRSSATNSILWRVLCSCCIKLNVSLQRNAKPELYFVHAVRVRDF